MGSIGSISTYVNATAAPKALKRVAEISAAAAGAPAAVAVAQAALDTPAMSQLPSEASRFLGDATAEIGELARQGLDAVGSAVDAVTSYADRGFQAAKQVLDELA